MSSKIYFVVYSSELNEPTSAQIIAGLDYNNDSAIVFGNADSNIVTGEQVLYKISGLVPNTSYKISFVWYDDTNFSNVATSAEFTTLNNSNNFLFFFMD